MHKGITLMDGVAMNQAHPDTFHIPSDEAKASVKPGDYVKIGFEFKNRAERMWVQVRSQGFGELNNDPVMVPMECGEPVYYEARHILSIINGKREDQEAIEATNKVIDVIKSCNSMKV